MLLIQKSTKQNSWQENSSFLVIEALNLSYKRNVSKAISGSSVEISEFSKEIKFYDQPNVCLGFSTTAKL